MRRKGLIFAALAVLAAPLAACGGAGGGSDSTSSGGQPSLIVLGASSLTEAITKYAEEFEGAEVKPSFGGSDELAAQIQQGVPADVFASADAGYPAELHEEGLVEEPVPFAANLLVIAVPEGSDIISLEDLAKPGVKLVIGDESVPVGAYTHEVLDHLPKAQREAILANVRSEETEVSSVVAKLEQGAADAGFVYVTDEKGAEGLEPVQVPAQLQPTVTYTVAVVSDSDAPDAAEEFVEGLVDGPGQEDLREAGFLSPP